MFSWTKQKQAACLCDSPGDSFPYVPIQPSVRAVVGERGEAELSSFQGNVLLHHTHRDGLIAVPGAPLLQDVQALWVMDVNTFLWGECWFLHKQNKPLAL